MSKSIIEAFVIPGKNGKPGSTMFGILDATEPFKKSKDGDEFANGLSFGAKKAALLLDCIENHLDSLRSELRAYINEPAEPAKAPEPVPAPIVATLPPPPAPVKAPEPPRPAEEPVKRAVYGGKTYGLFADGSTRQWMVIPGKRPHWKPVTTRIAWDAPDQLPVAVKPSAPAPTPASAPEKPVLREICDGDTLVILYLDGTYKLVNMAIA